MFILRPFFINENIEGINILKAHQILRF